MKAIRVALGQQQEKGASRGNLHAGSLFRSLNELSGAFTCSTQVTRYDASMNRIIFFFAAQTLIFSACPQDVAGIRDAGPTIDIPDVLALDVIGQDANEPDAGAPDAEVNPDVEVSADVEPGDAGPRAFTPVDCPADDGSQRRALVLVSNEQTDTKARLFQINEQGLVFETPSEVPLGEFPHGVEFNSSGDEALVIYGRGGTSNGVAVLSVATDGSSMSLSQALEFDTGFTPNFLTYSGDNHAFVTRIGGGQDNIVALVKQGGAWRVNPSIDMPEGQEFPHAVSAWPSRPGSALVMQADLLNSDLMSGQIFSVDDEGSIAETLSVPDGRHLFMYSHPTLDVAYIPARNPDDLSLVNPTGRLHVAAFENGAWQLQTPFFTPRLGSRWAFGAQGNRAMQASNIIDQFILDNNFVEEISAWVFVDVELNANGFPTRATNEAVIMRSRSVDEARLSNWGHLIVASDTGVYLPESEEVLSVFVDKGQSDWVQVCNIRDMPGRTYVAVAPFALD